MPQYVKYTNRRRRRRRPPARPRWGLMPLTALVIFALVAVLTHTGLGRRLEAAVAAAAQNETLSENLIRLVLPEGQSAGDAPPAEPLHAETPPPDEPSPPPFWEQTLPPEPDEDSHSGPLTARDAALLLPDPSVFESVMPELTEKGGPPAAPVSALTISGQEGGYEGSGTIYMRNETDLAIAASALLAQKNPVKLSGSGAQVLIMHTHGTEAYTPDAQHTYQASDPDRTTDLSRNVVRVGDEIARILEENGIKTLHSTVLNDYPAYNGSYNRALEDITRIVKDNPSIKVIIDVHRDALISQSGAKYKTVATIDGKQAAQLMFVAGTNQGGRQHDNWEQNLIFQLKLHDRMNTRYPGIMRPISIRTGRFNQHVTTGSMLLEVGTCGNSLSEALFSAQLFAQELAEILIASSPKT